VISAFFITNSFLSLQNAFYNGSDEKQLHLGLKSFYKKTFDSPLASHFS
jgi:hypothetical protein